MRRKTFTLPLVYFTACYFAAAAGYAVIGMVTKAIFGDVVVFGAAPRMPAYHYDHPFQYIAVVAFAYAVVASLWSFCRRNASSGWRRTLEIWLVMIVSVVLATPLGGLLFSWHDMQAGFIPTYWGAKLLHDASRSFFYTPIILFLSLPIALPGLWLGSTLTNAIDRWYCR
ncbi:MAG: hypothetical protein ACI4R9_07255 [Kiritimatiellia bacterium]